MIPAKGQMLIQYGVCLIILALAMIFFDPIQKKVTLYWTAKTGFVIPCFAGLATFICGLLAKKGKRDAALAGILVVFLMMCMLVMPMKKHWTGTFGSKPHFLYAACLDTLMFVLSFGTLVYAAKGMAYAQDEDETK